MLDTNGQPLPLGSAAYLAKYRTDLDTFFSTATASGAKVVYVVAPPMLDPTWNTTIVALRTIAKQLAANYHGISIANGPRAAVSASGRYTTTKHCLAVETTNPSCGVPGPGLITIRTITGTQTGIHFCPPGLQPGFPYACPTYASGEYRFGRSIAAYLVRPPPAVVV